MNIPALRFSEFYDDWEEKSLGEIGENIIGLTYSPKNVVKENGVIVLRSSNIKDDVLKLEDIVLVDSKIPERLFIQKNDILICTRNGSQRLIGKNILITDTKEKMTFGAFMSVFRSNQNHYISHLLKTESYHEQIQLNLGARINQITTSNLNKFTFKFPSMEEQNKISTFLSAVHDKLQQLKHEKAYLEQFKMGVMQKIFNQEIRFKDNNGKEFPEWEEKMLGEITFKVDKKNKSIEVLPIYSISNKNGFVLQSEQFEGIDSIERGYDTSLYKIVESNTFVYNPARINVGSIGYSGNLLRVIVSSLYVCFQTTEIVNDFFFNFYLETKHFNKSVIANAEGGVRDYLFYDNFSRITIVLPSIEEQTKIANFLSAINENITNITNQITLTEQWKKGLLQKMFV